MSAQTYAYTAVDTAGQRKNGVIDASNRDAAVAQLAADGRFVLEIRESDSSTSTSGSVDKKRKRPARQDLALFTRRLADLSLAGLPLDRVLHVVAEQSESAALRDVAAEALTDVRSGLPVSQALAKHPKFFNDVYTQTLRAGEASGQFGEAATRLADFQEMEVARRSQIVSALVYPAILTATAIMVVVFLLTFVVPRLSDVFNDLGDDLPFTTKILLSSTNLLVSHWMLVVGTIIVAIVGARIWLSTPGGAFTRDKMLLQAPMIGPVITKATLSRFARVLGTLLYGGVPILDALQIAGLSAGNRVFLASAQAVEQEVRDGRPIGVAMTDAAFPPVLTHMVSIGEETGDLPKMLARVADSLDFEVDTSLRRLISLMEPVIVLTMGGFVGFVVLSVLLPIFQAQTLVK